MDIAQRIAQFENMCQADPDNEMAFFSLGGAYVQAGRFADAASAYLRCTELVPGMSKAYQLAAENFLKAGAKDRAGELALRGYTIASEKGDRMPMQALGTVLESLGKAIPKVAAPTPAAGGESGRTVSIPLGGSGGSPVGNGGGGGFMCRRTGRPGNQLSRPPFRGPIGKWIHENISAETWDSWIRQGTKVINELRLDLSREQDAETYDQHMREYLGIDEALYTQLNGKS